MHRNYAKLSASQQAHEADVARRAVMEERQSERMKQLRFQPILEKIRISRARGMSDGSLIRIYGAEAVQMEREASCATSGRTRTDAVLPPPVPDEPLSATQARVLQRRALRG